MKEKIVGCVIAALIGVGPAYAKAASEPDRREVILTLYGSELRYSAYAPKGSVLKNIRRKHKGDPAEKLRQMRMAAGGNALRSKVRGEISEVKLADCDTAVSEEDLAAYFLWWKDGAEATLSAIEELDRAIGDENHFTLQPKLAPQIANMTKIDISNKRARRFAEEEVALQKKHACLYARFPSQRMSNPESILRFFEEAQRADGALRIGATERTATREQQEEKKGKNKIRPQSVMSQFGAGNHGMIRFQVAVPVWNEERQLYVEMIREIIFGFTNDFLVPLSNHKLFPDGSYEALVKSTEDAGDLTFGHEHYREGLFKALTIPDGKVAAQKYADGAFSAPYWMKQSGNVSLPLN